MRALLPAIRNIPQGYILVALTVIAVLGSFMLFKNDFLSSILIVIAINILVTSAFRFVLLIGELNFATSGLVGIGAYASGLATTHYFLPFFVSLFIAISIATVVSLAFGYVTLRSKGPYFMLISFAFAEVLRLIFTQAEALGENSGMVGIYPPDWLWRFYPEVVFIITVLTLILLFLLERSAFGKVLAGVRSNDLLLQTFGINVHFVKVCSLGVAGAVAGLAGALQAHANTVISPGDFSFLLSAFALAYLKIGGDSHIIGAVLGAALLTVLAQVALSFGGYEHIFYGAAIVIAVLLMPGGLVGIYEKFKATRGNATRHQDAGEIVK